jgi:hypothetical protein
VLGAMLVLRTRGSQREEREKKDGPHEDSWRSRDSMVAARHRTHWADARAYLR